MSKMLVTSYGAGVCTVVIRVGAAVSGRLLLFLLGLERLDALYLRVSIGLFAQKVKRIFTSRGTEDACLCSVQSLTELRTQQTPVLSIISLPFLLIN